MQAVKVIINGSFIDSQVYAGSLHLFTDEGDIVILDWENAINDLIQRNPNAGIALRAAFLDSQLFYDNKVRHLLSNKNIKIIIERQFEQISGEIFEFNSVYDRPFKPNFQSNPFPFPHADTEIYYDRLYVGLKSGLFSSQRDITEKRIERQIYKHWDAPVLDLAGSIGYTSMAIASGSNGLYELPIKPKNKNPDKSFKPNELAPLHCTGCDWSYFSIYGSSYYQPSFLASFEKMQEQGNQTRKIRHLKEIISSKELFNRDGFSWGAHDKIYLYHDGLIEVTAYNPNKKNPFISLGQIRLSSWKGDVISAGVAPFGTVIECDNALVIILSNNDIITIPGEPVGWRVFSRSRHYTNQLHIVYDDHLEIWSFNQDYFVEQKHKLAGTLVEMKLSPNNSFAADFETGAE